ncbi:MULTISPECIES: TldD/PmbA family protein [unclassified Archaeoglobus]|uniref:TldD/PmbA family protein n=1 Tax=unclassified Archaeoglobus TaxID=2643606 RepID=UPI0025BDEE15|nr:MULTISPECIES: TldD/PmbA family protein [unclassified Archaeoglobus]
MEWEIYEYKVKGISAEIEAGKLKSVESYVDSGFSARVIVNGRVGFASSSFSKEKAIEMAEKIARVSEDILEDFPSGKYKKVEGIYDKKVEKVDSEFLKDEYEIIVSSARKANISSASISHEVKEVRISNSFGLECAEKTTSSVLIVETVYDGGSAYEIRESRDVKLDIEEAVRRAEELAIESSKAEKIESGIYDVLFEPIAVHQLLFYSLYPSFSAENVEKGRSAVKIGDMLGRVNIRDDPTIEGGLMSCSFDDEGVDTKPTMLVEDGIVKNYYTDWKHSKKYGVTGNGFRMDETSFPTPLPSNVVIEVEEMCDDDNCLKIHTLIGSHTSNPISGDFSLECMNASIGDRPVKGAMIYGNIFEVLKKLEGEFGEKRQVENTVTRSLRFKDLRVI